MRELVIKLLVFIVIICFSIIICYQDVKIENLNREVYRLKNSDKNLSEQIKEVRQENKRYLDSCLDFILVLEEGKQE